jgi:hypothetical protein
MFHKATSIRCHSPDYRRAIRRSREGNGSFGKLGQRYMGFSFPNATARGAIPGFREDRKKLPSRGAKQLHAYPSSG